MNFPAHVRACLLAVVFLLAAAALVQSADPHPYHEGNYGTAGLPHTDLAGSQANSWDYADLKAWPQLCQTGSRQSPISFTNVDPREIVRDAPLKRLQFSSKCFFPKDKTEMRIVNEGAVNVVSFERQGRLPEDLSECTLADPLNKSRIFYFSELHFHATSEHMFRSLRPDVEMHISFVTDEAKEKKREMLVVAVMLKASTSINSTSVRALRHILVDGSLPRRHAMTTCFLTEDMSITSLLPPRESYLLYDGSLTHPPCRENVRWIVMTSPILISRVAVGKLRDSMHQLLPNDFHRFGNARPPQALNGRRIYRFDDTSVPQGGHRREGNLDDAWTKKMKRNGAVVVNNETIVDDIFRAQEEEDAGNSTLVDVDFSADEFNSTSTTTTQGPGMTESATDAANSSGAETAAVHNTTTKPDDRSAKAASSASKAAAESRNTTMDPHAAPNHSSGNSSTPAPAEEAAAAEATTTTTTSTPTTSTTSSTSTTKKPAPRKGKRGNHSPTKNISETATASDTAAGVTKSINATASSAWARMKNFVARAVPTTVTYVKHHPIRAALIGVANLVLFYLICTCIRGWKSPVYVVGIDPRELQPLHPNTAFGQYGGTGAAAVPSANPPTA
ncbi:carbonic anhydrase-like protein [Leptomonas pyrrhocoris]|uniref:carbonic anhydrase n=1 Tax=Leptomonas pyrrhocoris TaxID=157538 RepID=A0A0N1J5D5_LEPPY|nr:carbonic anhydrase-like protein [Leptomonas pyrrhocoris]XP_015663958.1 carbonic anhydrase-like protein [Leptomonas pyrrhocoris]KPA85518.1 carbonic anhydrase-like protein [Leptomonas pyrrhocoris]KPA85519.1 carbonic anhydrase-like protein [Leptomonas pyrrhocoris]|eukprot:XP_015663957.1 carbonic anhydrase-like protein [Leptomonas pyrrhocoris]